MYRVILGQASNAEQRYCFLLNKVMAQGYSQNPLSLEVINPVIMYIYGGYPAEGAILLLIVCITAYLHGCNVNGFSFFLLSLFLFFYVKITIIIIVVVHYY